MTEPSSSWPPPPEMPAALSEHDDFLVACIRGWALKQPILRGQLAGKLIAKTGLDYKSCLAIVNNFCNYHAILVPEHSLVVWSGILLPLIMITLRTAMLLVMEQRHDAATTRLERVTLTAEKHQLDVLLIGVWVAATVASLIWAIWRKRRLQEQAAEAIAKFGGAG